MGWARAASMMGLTFALVGAGSAMVARHGAASIRHEVEAVPSSASPTPSTAPSAPGPVFVTRQAVALVEGNARRPATLRAVAGFSMGGYGAAALALRHPDEYRQVAAFSGYYRVDDPDGVFGRQTSAHAPDRLVSKATGQRFFLVEGTDEHTPLQTGSIRGEADRFAAMLRARHVTVSV